MTDEEKGKTEPANPDVKTDVVAAAASSATSSNDSDTKPDERKNRGYAGRRRGRHQEEEIEVRALPEFKRVTGPSLKPDPKYGSMLVAKFVNCMMWRGKKTTTYRIFYDAMDTIAKRTNDDPLKVFEEAMENVKPQVEVKSRRVGGATYQVPVPVNPKRQLSLAIRWILGAARGKTGKPMTVKLANELLDAHKKEGLAIKKREDTHRMAEANKAFAHFAW